MMTRRVLVFLSVACVFAATSLSAEAAFPGTNGRIAYWRYDRQKILTMAADGTDIRRLLPGIEGWQRDPSWSADGARIVFVRTVFRGPTFRERCRLESVAGTGSHLRLIAGPGVLVAAPKLPLYPWGPVWSPDGTHIAFNGLGRGARRDPKVFVIGSDGAGLTNISGKGNVDFAPSWSPDGSRIAVATRHGGIATMDPDGTNRIVIVPNPNGAEAFDPDWSPDGSRIAFSMRFDDPSPYGNSDLFVVDADGSDLTRLTTTKRQEYEPAWAPDGSAIVYSRTQTRHPEERRDLFVIASAGGTPAPLTQTQGRDEEAPSWQAIPST